MDAATILGLIIGLGWYGNLCFGRLRNEDAPLERPRDASDYLTTSIATDDKTALQSTEEEN